MSFQTLSSVFLLSLFVGSAIAHPHVHARAAEDSLYKIDVHQHVIPEVWRQALIDHNVGPTIDGVNFADGIPVPAWNLTTHIEVMNSENLGYGMISISSPGVSFLADDPVAAAKLAREVNLEMYSYIQQYPTRLGGLCLLPLPDVAAALIEIQVWYPFFPELI